MSDLSIKVEGYPEKVQRIADVLEEAFPGLLLWDLSPDDDGAITIKLEGYEVPLMPVQVRRFATSSRP